MEDLAKQLRDAAEAGKVPHAVACAVSQDSIFTYEYATGHMFDGKKTAVDANTVLRLASATKFLTTIAALQIVDDGLFGIDQDVANILPELAEQPVLNGFDDSDQPIFTRRRSLITLRHLLTHTSGLAYGVWSSQLKKVQQMQPERVREGGPTIMDRCSFPLLFEPGTSWVYGVGVDWAGKLVERVTGSTLEEHFHENICQPLGLRSITFWPEQHAKMPVLTKRRSDGGLKFTTATFMQGTKDCFGGQGGYASIRDFLAVQGSILANDGKLLERETVEMMFTPQLGAESNKALHEFVLGPGRRLLSGEFKTSIPLDWGLGGILFMKDDDGRRKAGTMAWGGIVNTFWAIDRETGIALTFGTQVLAPGDAQVRDLISATEYAVYEEYLKSR